MATLIVALLACFALSEAFVTIRDAPKMPDLTDIVEVADDIVGSGQDTPDDNVADTKPNPDRPVTPLCVYTNNCTEESASDLSSQAKSKKEYVVENTFKANWFQAWNACARKGYRLATVSSPAEELQLVEAIQKAGSMMDVWLGATDLGQVGKFSWMATGLPVTYTNWHVGEPSFLRHRYEPCILLFKGRVGYRWHNAGCYNSRYFACEFSTLESDDFDLDVRKLD